MDLLRGFLVALKQSNYATGIEHFVRTDGTMYISVVIVRKRGQYLKIISKNIYSSLEELAGSITDKYPVYISIDGKVVLHKELSSGNSDKDAPARVPDNNDSELVSQTVVVTEKTSFVSYVRQTVIDSILSSYSDKGYYLHGITLGPFSCLGIIDTSGEGKVVKLPYYDLIISKEGVKSLHKREFVNSDQFFSIGEDNLELGFLVPFFNTVAHFGGQGLPSISEAFVMNCKREFLFKSIMSRTKLPLVGMLFLILLGNFLAYEHYRSDNQKMETLMASLKPAIEKYESLSHNKKVSDEFYSTGGSWGIPMMAFYSDRLAGSIPEGISLVRMIIAPPVKKVPGLDQRLFQHEIIVINGTAVSSISVNTWIKLLREFEWIEEVKLLIFSDYGKGMSDFSLEISIVDI